MMIVNNINDEGMSLTEDGHIFVKAIDDAVFFPIGKTSDNWIGFNQIDRAFQNLNLASGKYQFFVQGADGQKRALDAPNFETIMHEKDSHYRKTFFHPKQGGLLSFYPKVTLEKYAGALIIPMAGNLTAFMQALDVLAEFGQQFQLIFVATKNTGAKALKLVDTFAQARKNVWVLAGEAGSLLAVQQRGLTVVRGKQWQVLRPEEITSADSLAYARKSANVTYTKLEQVVQALKLTDKTMTRNYKKYLRQQYPALKSFVRKKEPKQLVATYEKGAEKFVIKYTKKFKKATQISTYQAGQPKQVVTLDQQQNVSAIKTYGADGRSTTTYVDGDVKPLLVVTYTADDQPIDYKLHLLGKIQTYQRLHDLAADLTPLNLKNLDLAKKKLYLAKVALTDRVLTMTVSAALQKDIQAFKLGELPLDVVSVAGDEVQLALPEQLANVRGPQNLTVNYRGINLALSPLCSMRMHRVQPNQEVALSADVVGNWGINHNDVYRMLVRTTEINERLAVTTANPVQISAFKLKKRGVVLNVADLAVTDFQLFTKQAGQLIKIPVDQLNEHQLLVRSKQWLKNGEVYVVTTTDHGDEIRKLQVDQLLQKTVKQLGDVTVAYRDGKLVWAFANAVTGPKDGFTLSVKNRGSKEVMSLTSQVTAAGELEFAAAIDDLPWLEEPNLQGYETTLFDVALEFASVKTATPVRVKWHPAIPEEVSGQYTATHGVIVQPYGTSNKQELSLRFYFMTNEALNYYHQQQATNLTVARKKPLVIVVESPDKAQDNGLEMFKYLVDEKSAAVDTYYVITENSPDIKNLAGYEAQILPYKSVQHFEMMAQANMILHTNSSFYAYPLNTQFWQTKRLAAKKIFLQHGIIGVRDLSNLYGADPLFTNKFIVSSRREKKLVVGKMRYKADDVSVAGLARFDSLLAPTTAVHAAELRQRILIMPSWRKHQDNLAPEQFMETEFYRGWQAFLNHPEFVQLVQAQGLEVGFYLHHNFQKYNDLFHSPVVTVLAEGDDTIQNHLKQHGILITDFSSVALDFSLQERPVFYYQVDDFIRDDLKTMQGFFPGEIYFAAEPLLADLTQALAAPALSDKQKAKLDKLYLHRDANARKRTYQLMLRTINEDKYKLQKRVYKKVRRTLGKRYRKVRRMLHEVV